MRGLPSEDFLTVVPEKNETVREVLLGIEGVQSVKKAWSRYFSDKWVLIILKDKQTEVLTEFEEQITVYYKHQKGQSKLVLAGPKKIITPTLTGNRVHTYAYILKQRYSTSNTSKKQENKHKSRDIEEINSMEDLSSAPEDDTAIITPADNNNKLAATENGTYLEDNLLQRI